MRALPGKRVISIKKVVITSLLLLHAVTYGDGAEALVRFDFERSALYIRGLRIKDHSVLIDNGTFHVFFIKGNEKSFGHAVSEDLTHWEILDDVLFAGPEEYDETFVWAPFVLPYPERPLYRLMFYTGVNRYISQMTALAISTDLDRWTKSSPALFVPFHGDTAWIEWSDTSWSNFRDPCIFVEGDTCYMVNTVKTRSGTGALSLHASTDFFTWKDSGPLYIHDNWHVLESPYLLKYGGKYRLFFTEEEVGGVSYMYSDSLRTGWDITKRMIIDPGHAAEVTELNGDEFLFSRHFSYIAPSGEVVSAIVFDTLRWDGDTPRIERKDSFSENWKVVWGDAFANQPTFGDNPSFRGDDTTSVGFQGNWWIGTYESFGGPLSSTSPGSIQGDEATGGLRSRTFTVTGWSMKLLVGGGMYPDSCYVALVDEETGEIIYKETGKNTDEMDERTWNLKPVRGKRVYIEIVDDCKGVFGHINVDSIVESNRMVDDGGKSIDTGKETKEIRLSSTLDLQDRDSGVPTLSCHPNPSNPSTTFLFRVTGKGSTEIVIFDVSGRVVRRISAGQIEPGAGAITWNGTDDFGRSVPSGVYIVCLMENSRLLAGTKVVLIR